MKIRTHLATAAVMLGIAFTAFWAVPAGAGSGKSPLVAPPNSHAYGYSLNDWLTTFWEWTLNGGDPAQSKVGDVQLMPLPAGEQIGGDISDPENPAYFRGTLEITVPSGTPIVLPEFAIYYEMYEDGSTDAIFPDEELLASVHPTLTIDGVPVITDANKAMYYVPATYFDPPIYYPEPTEYGTVAIALYQGVGVVIKPLPVGQHTIHLYEPWIFDPYWNLIYDNTWHVTVTP